MYSRLNQTQNHKQARPAHQLQITDRYLANGEKLNVETIHLDHHKPGDFSLNLENVDQYLYITNTGSVSISYRLNNNHRLDHIQKNRKRVMVTGDKLTLFIPYIDADDQSKSEQLLITFLEDGNIDLSLN